MIPIFANFFGGRSLSSLRPADAARFRVCGLVAGERELSFDDLRALPAEFQIPDAGKFAAGVSGQAVRLAGIMAANGVKPHALYVNAGTRDGALRLALFRREIEALALVVYARDGAPLSAAQGGPFRLVLPGLAGAARDVRDLGWLEFAKSFGPDNRAEFDRRALVVVGQQAFDERRTWRDPRDAETIVIPPPNS